MEDNPLKDTLAIKYIAHFRHDLRNSLFLAPEKEVGQNSKQNKLIFPGSNSIILNSLTSNFENQKVQSFLHTLPGSRGITALTQSLNRKYLAWAEETEKYPVIVFVDLTNNKRKMFATETKSKKYISLAFNGNEGSDPKTLVALTSGPQYTLVQWNFEKNKYVSNVIDRLPQGNKQTSQKYNAAFFYREEDFVVLIGRGTIKTYKLVNDKIQLKDSPFARKQVNQKDYNFLSFCVLKDGLVVGTDNGQLFYFTASCQFKVILQASPGEGFSIDTLLPLHASKSFLAGGSDGLLYLFEKGDVKNIYVKSQRRLIIKDFKGRITSLLITPKQDELFIGMQPGIILRASIDKSEEFKYQYALQSFHTESITGMDVCLRKPLVATCSFDKTVRIWNYLQKNNQQISKSFEEKALSLSFHPSGFHLVVSFPDKIRLINISDNDLVPYKDISQKNCYEVKFSNGGHLFAVVNNVMVQIYNFYTCQQPQNYQFKAQTGKFQCILWEDDDLGIFLGTSDGAVYYNKLEDPTVRLQILSVPGFSVKSISSQFISKDQKQGSVALNERIVYIAGVFSSSFQPESRCIYEVKITPKPQKQKQRTELIKDETRYIISAPTKIFTAVNVSRLGMLNSKKIFFYCTEQRNGPAALRLSKYPFGTAKEIFEIQSHSAPITKLVICHDDSYLFTCGEDGSLVIYEIKQHKIKLQALDPAEQFLYAKLKLKQQKTLVQDLRLKNTDAKQKRDKIAKQSRSQNQRLINQWRMKIAERQKIEAQKMKLQIEEMARIEKQQEKRLRTLEQQHKTKRQNVERDYSQKIQLQQTRKIQLAKAKQSQALTFRQILQINKKRHDQEKERRTAQFKQELERQRREKDKLANIETELQKKNLEEQAKWQALAQKQIKQRKQQHEALIKKLQNQNSIAETQKIERKRDYDQQEKDLDQEKHRLKHTLQKIQTTKQHHQEYLQKKQSHAKQIDEREKTIRDKVTRIHELKKKTQQLEKFKFVLDYKIKELKRDIGPRQEQIAKMKEQISNMNAEIIHFKRTNDNMTLIVKDLVSKRTGMETEISQQNTKENNNLQYIKSFEYDISEMYQNCMNDFKKLKAKMLEIFRKYVQDDDDKKKKIQSIDQQKQFIKQRAHLQSTVKGLKDKFKNNMILHQADNKRVMGQNEDLISQINDLKREKKNMMDEIKKRNLQKQLAGKLEEDRKILQKEGEDLQKQLHELKNRYEQELRKKKRPNQGRVFSQEKEDA